MCVSHVLCCVGVVCLILHNTAAIMESLRERLTAAEPQVALVSSWKQSILYLEILTKLKSLPLSSLSLSLSLTHPLCLQRALFVMEALLHSDIPDTLSLLTQCLPDLAQLADTAAHPPTRSKATKVPTPPEYIHMQKYYTKR